MDPTVIVLIVTLALPSGQESVQVKPMPTAEQCKAAADIEISDPFVSSVTCSELTDGILHLKLAAGDSAKRSVVRLP